jgi:uncharacterized protein YbaR (Trm112 family)
MTVHSPNHAPNLTGWVRDALRCPACHGDLDDDGSRLDPAALTCSRCRLRFPARDGIVHLLLDDAETLP